MDFGLAEVPNLKGLCKAFPINDVIARRNRLLALSLSRHYSGTPPQDRIKQSSYATISDRLPQERQPLLPPRKPCRHKRLPCARSSPQMHRSNPENRHLVCRGHPPHHPRTTLPLLQLRRRRRSNYRNRINLRAEAHEELCDLAWGGV